MFLRRRSRQAECFDEFQRPLKDIARDYRQLARVNRLFRHADPFTRLLQRARSPERWRSLSFLEVGAGSGQLADELTTWAARREWRWTFTCLDANPAALELNPVRHKLLGDATRLPFPDGAFDVVIASQMTHHLEDDAVIRHFREAWRVAREVVIISDLHRNPFLLGLVTVVPPFLGVSGQLCADGRLSVRRGFTIPEWQTAAREAGLHGVRVEVQFGCRIVLWADHRGSSAA